MDWYELTGKYHKLTLDDDCNLDSLPELWQRELAAVWRLEADVNNGGYLQFLSTWGVSSHEYGVTALQKIGAQAMADLIIDAHAVLSQTVCIEELSQDELAALIPNPVTDLDGTVIKQSGSTLPDDVLEKLYDLSYKFMDYPEDIPALGLKYYMPLETSNTQDNGNK